MANAEVEQLWARITCPTLLIYGNESGAVRRCFAVLTFWVDLVLYLNSYLEIIGADSGGVRDAHPTLTVCEGSRTAEYVWGSRSSPTIERKIGRNAQLFRLQR